MAVEVDTAQGFEFGPPRRLFNAPDAIPVRGIEGNFGSSLGAVGNVSRDGQRVVFAVPPARVLRQLTVFDRGGNVVSRLGEPGPYSQSAFSPDGSRVAVVKQDLQTGIVNVWTFDLSTGNSTPVAPSGWPTGLPIWQPDGTQVAYTSARESTTGIYRRAWNGNGIEELLFRNPPGVSLNLTDLSADGRFLTVNSGEVQLVVPITGDDPLVREAIEFAREEFEVRTGRFSPDSRFLAYQSNESSNFEVYVQPFDASSGTASAGDKWQVSHAGTIGGIAWRQDGEEMFYLAEDPDTTDVNVMAVEVTTTPVFQAGTPQVLFRLPGPLPGNSYWKSVSSDGQRFVFAMPVP